MTRQARILGAVAVSIGLLLGAAGVAIAKPSLELTFEPPVVARGDILMITAAFDCSGSTSLAGTTLRFPLPVGFDQWTSEVRIDDAAWTAYPANGLISLDPMPASKQRTVKIRALVEHAAPESFSVTASVYDVGGELV